MRSQTFEFDELTDEFGKMITLYIVEDGGLDDDGNERPPYKNYLYQNHYADVQPKSGTKRAEQSGTVYESSHVVYLPKTAKQVPTGAILEVLDDVTFTALDRYEVVFVANHGSHLEVDLKAVET